MHSIVRLAVYFRPRKLIDNSNSIAFSAAALAFELLGEVLEYEDNNPNPFVVLGGCNGDDDGEEEQLTLLLLLLLPVLLREPPEFRLLNDDDDDFAVVTYLTNWTGSILASVTLISTSTTDWLWLWL